MVTEKSCNLSGSREAASEGPTVLHIHFCGERNFIERIKAAISLEVVLAIAIKQEPNPV